MVALRIGRIIVGRIAVSVADDSRLRAALDFIVESSIIRDRGTRTHAIQIVITISKLVL